MPGLATLNVFGTLTVSVPLGNFDINFNRINAIIASVNNYSNYFVDIGAANVYVVTLPAGLSGTLTAGLAIQFQAANANTGASTLNFNGTGAKPILHKNGAALSAGEIPAGGIISVMYDGNEYQVMG